MIKRRTFLLVMDSVGVGALPDAGAYGDEGSFTLRSVAQTGRLHLPHLCALGLSRIPGMQGVLPDDGAQPRGAYGRMAERSRGKDTTTGHWELAGLVSDTAFPTYPDGFPPALIQAFSEAVGRPVLCNRPYSGTEVIRDYGREQMACGGLIVYTSADSVFQIAAHTDVVPLGELYRCCMVAREMLKPPHGVGRVIARPFSGTYPDFVRTPDRRDFALPPPSDTVNDLLSRAGRDVIGVGKIGDIFAQRGLTRSLPVHGNADCCAATLQMAGEVFDGLCFVNLVDFDMLYGHRNDAEGYAAALNVFDDFLGGLLPMMRQYDLLIVTADHGCDPATPSTDHSREYVPLLVYGQKINAVPLGTRTTFADVAATVAAWHGVPYTLAGTSFLQEVCHDA